MVAAAVTDNTMHRTQQVHKECGWMRDRTVPEKLKFATSNALTNLLMDDVSFRIFVFTGTCF
jgi:hypothetical protein